jgi:hypothetical protein
MPQYGTVLRQLFEVLGGCHYVGDLYRWPITVTVTAEQSRAQDPVSCTGPGRLSQSRVASFLYGCSERQRVDPPSDLASADCIEMDDILHHALEVCNNDFVELHLKVVLDEPFDFYSNTCCRVDTP